MQITINKPITINLSDLNDLIYQNEKSFFGTDVHSQKVDIRTAMQNAKDELDSWDSYQIVELEKDLGELNKMYEKLKISIPLKIKKFKENPDDEMIEILSDVLVKHEKDIQDKQNHINLVNSIYTRLTNDYKTLKKRVDSIDELQKTITLEF